MATEIVAQSGSRSPLVFEALPEDGLMRRCPDIALAVDRLRWRPRVAFREGIARTIEYFTHASVTGRVPGSGSWSTTTPDWPARDTRRA